LNSGSQSPSPQSQCQFLILFSLAFSSFYGAVFSPPKPVASPPFSASETLFLKMSPLSPCLSFLPIEALSPHSQNSQKISALCTYCQLPFSPCFRLFQPLRTCVSFSVPVQGSFPGSDLFSLSPVVLPKRGQVNPAGLSRCFFPPVGLLSPSLLFLPAQWIGPSFLPQTSLFFFTFDFRLSQTRPRLFSAFFRSWFPY